MAKKFIIFCTTNEQIDEVLLQSGKELYGEIEYIMQPDFNPTILQSSDEEILNYAEKLAGELLVRKLNGEDITFLPSGDIVFIIKIVSSLNNIGIKCVFPLFQIVVTDKDYKYKCSRIAKFVRFRELKS